MNRRDDEQHRLFREKTQIVHPKGWWARLKRWLGWS